MEQIQQAYGLLKETVTVIIMLYKNTKAMVHSPDGNTDFEIVPGVLQGNTLVPYLLILCLDYVLQMPEDQIKENCLTLKKAISTRYPKETIIDSDQANDLALLINTPVHAKSLQHNLEQAARDIGLYINVKKNRVHVF